MNSLLQKLYRWKFHHILLWLSYFVFFVWVYRGYYTSLLPLFGVTGLYMVFNALAFYLIAYFLVARYLNPGRVLLFITLAVSVLLLCTVGLSIGLYLAFKDVSTAKAFVNNPGLVFMASLSSMLVIVGSFTAGKLIIDKVRSDRKTKVLDQQRLATELQYLKAQVNPHFLFNAINSVYILIRKDPEKASQTLIQLSDLLRFQLYDCSGDRIAIEREMENLENYVGLEQLRKGDKVDILFSRASDIGGFQVAPFLFIPFLENAFKFVSSNNATKAFIQVEFSKMGNLLTALFVNSHDDQPSEGPGGIGLRNVKRRLELIYPKKYQLDINSANGVFQVRLTLDVS
jgi:two-component system, LytTR family, sensor kinase